MNKKTITKALLIVVLCLSFNKLFAQKIIETIERDNYLAISISPALFQPLAINQLEGKKYLKSAFTIAGSSQLQFYRKLNNNFTLKLGVGIKVIPNNIRYEFEDSMSNRFVQLLEQSNSLRETPLSNYRNGIFVSSLKSTEYYQLAYLLSFSLSKNIIENEKRIIFGELGFEGHYIENISAALGQTYTFFNNTDMPQVSERVFQYRLFHTDIEDREYRLLPSLLVAFGISTKEKKYLAQAKLFVNYVPKLLSTGTYKFYNLREQSYGNLKQRINSIGVSLVFGLSTKKRKRIILKEKD